MFSRIYAREAQLRRVSERKPRLGGAFSCLKPAWLLDVVALDEIDADRAQGVEVFLRLDLLGDHLEADGTGQASDRRNDLVIQAVFVQIVSVCAVDLEEIYREILQAGK